MAPLYISIGTYLGYYLNAKCYYIIYFLVGKLHSTIQQAQTITTMDQIINNPGLQHITENILLNLDFKNLHVCQSANKNFGQILANNPVFWLKKFRLITKSPGLQSLQQINEDVFLDFDLPDLEFLESVNETFAKILDKPTFWLKNVWA